MKRQLATAILGIGIGFAASAAPIAYHAPLQNGVPVVGAIGQANANVSNPEGAEYYRFFANAGDNVTVIGDRLDGPYDMAFWVFAGLFADTSAFGASFDEFDPGFVIVGDDEDPPNIVGGPFGDPHVVFAAPSTGFYTVAVTNFLSNGTPPYDFQLVARGIQNVPEPAPLALLGLSLAGLGLVRRKKS